MPYNQTNPFDLYSNTGSGSGMASGLSNFGLGSNPSQASAPRPALPTTAGDYGKLTGISSDLMAQSDAMMNADPSQLDIWQGRNGFGKALYNKDGSFDLGAAGSILGGLGSLGSLYLGFQAQKTAKDTLKFKEKAYETNMANQISSFNMALEDRANARATRNNTSQAETESYIDKHKL